MTTIQFDIQQDIKRKATESADTLYVGLSGGLDSIFLLYQSVQAAGAESVVAVHVNHQLSAQAGFWQQHCEHVCQALGCRFIAVAVDVNNVGKGVEAAARQARYQVFADQLPARSVLLLGHHLDDQVETFFLRLFRGAGPTGLQGIALATERDHYFIYRPLLAITRQQIHSIAVGLGLVWIEDESNQDTRFDRNFLRQQVLPLIETRWPGYRDKIQQTMALMESPVSETSQSFDVQGELEHRLSHDLGLKLVQVDDFSDAQLMSLLHAWLTRLGLQIPSQARLKTIVEQVITARSDAQPLVELGAGSIRRHGPALYWVANQPAPQAPPTIQLGNLQNWPGVGNVAVRQDDQGSGRLTAQLPDLHWQLRCGGEVLRPEGRSKSRDLKRLLQEYRVKPWLRDRTPLLFSGDVLVAVGDILVSADHLALENEPGLRIIWQNSD